MSVTININGLSLCHKGSNGISTATVPDVCKTPTPGGPVPTPYPNISMSSDLVDGSTTVTADGGNMIAIKGSSFSRSTGDEPGTLGGVKSSVNMKASKWILYSFDVKIDGENACRLTDKKTQNNENAVDATGLVQAPLVTTPLHIECKDKKRSNGDSWTKCDYEQFCGKLEEVNKQAKAGELKKAYTLPEVKSRLEAAKSMAQAKIRQTWEALPIQQAPPALVQQQFYSKCAYDEWMDKGADPHMSGWEPDHIHEVQLGGDPMALENFKWCKNYVNGSLGATLKAYQPEKHTGVSADCCPA